MAQETSSRSTLKSDAITERRSPIEIRPPAPAELRACRMMLPEAFEHGVTPDLLLAVEPSPRRFVGALSYSAAVFGKDLAWRIQLHVVRGHRRCGIGRSLVDALVALSIERRVTALVGIQPEQAVDGPLFLTALGFTPAYRSSVYVAALSQYHSIIQAFVDRIRAKGMLPGRARSMTPLSSPHEPLLAFLRDTALRAPRLMETPWEDLCRRPAVREASVALLDGDEVVGAILAERRGTLAEVHWRVVAPAYRRGWANVMLTAAVWDRMVDIGVTHIKFSTTSDTPDTESLVVRFGVEQAYRLDHYLRRMT